MMTSLQDTQVFSKVHTTLNLDPVYQALEAVEPGMLVVFDVDQVLLDPTDWILSGQGSVLKFEHFNDIITRLGQEKFDYLYSIIVRDRTMVPLASHLPEAIVRLQNRGIATLALTAFWDGPYGVIDDMSAFRVRELKATGYDFSQGQPVPDCHYPEHLSPRLNRHPRLKNGVITTSHISKGAALLTYLRTHHLHPTKIIFVDDNEGFMRDVQKACAGHGLPFEGYHLLHASPYSASKDPVIIQGHQRRAALQFYHLEHYAQWLDDAAAEALLPH